MINQNQFNLLRLIRSDNIGVTTLKRLLNKYQTAQAVIANISEINSKIKRKINLATEKSIKDELKLLESLNAKLIFQDDCAYPQSLKFLDDAPVCLACIGDVGLLKQDQIAIVGSRQVSEIGKRYTRKVASCLAEKGFVITSGMARGVDTLAHEGALQAGGKTIAVLGSSVDFIYPSENEKLYKEIIAKGGLIISENATGTGIVSKHQFPKRNRIIASLSKAIVVTECTKKSGSLITARLALEMGKDLFAVPGHPADLHFEGTNSLIKQNCAYLLTSMDDILQQIDLPNKNRLLQLKQKQVKELFDIVEENEELEIIRSDSKEMEENKTLVDLIKNNPMTAEEIGMVLGLSQQQVGFEITTLELSGRLKRLNGGYVELQTAE
jgi:DNA processing protein